MNIITIYLKYNSVYKKTIYIKPCMTTMHMVLKMFNNLFLWVNIFCFYLVFVSAALNNFEFISIHPSIRTLCRFVCFFDTKRNVHRVCVCVFICTWCKQLQSGSGKYIFNLFFLKKNIAYILRQFVKLYYSACICVYLCIHLSTRDL